MVPKGFWFEIICTCFSRKFIDLVINKKCKNNYLPEFSLWNQTYRCRFCTCTQNTSECPVSVFANPLFSRTTFGMYHNWRRCWQLGNESSHGGWSPRRKKTSCHNSDKRIRLLAFRIQADVRRPAVYFRCAAFDVPEMTRNPEIPSSTDCNRAAFHQTHFDAAKIIRKWL